MKHRWKNILGLDGDYDEQTLYFDEKHYRIYEVLCECCEKKLTRIQ